MIIAQIEGVASSLLKMFPYLHKTYIVRTYTISSMRQFVRMKHPDG